MTKQQQSQPVTTPVVRDPGTSVLASPVPLEPVDSAPERQPQVMHAVEENDPIQLGHVRFQIGEQIAWKGLHLQLTMLKGQTLVFKIVGVTANAKKRYAKQAGTHD